MRILFVFAWLGSSDEEADVRLLSQALDPARHTIDIVACFNAQGVPEQSNKSLAGLGVRVDLTPYHLSFEETVAYLASIIPGYDAVVSCQNVADIYPALERMHLRPPLIERGSSVPEALAGPKHFTVRYAAASPSIRDAAASCMPGREHFAIQVPLMVDMCAFNRATRAPMRGSLGLTDDMALIGWVGQLDAKSGIEDFIAAAATVRSKRPAARFVVIGKPDVSMPDYVMRLRGQARRLGLDSVLTFLGDRADVPAMLSALDMVVSLSCGERPPHDVCKAGGAGLPVIVTPETDATVKIDDGTTGLLVPHNAPIAVAETIVRLIDGPLLRRHLGDALKAKVRATCSVEAVVPQWETLFDEVCGRAPVPPPALFRSFFQGGFECSTHRRAHDRRRIDVIASTRHDEWAKEDYEILGTLGILTVRDGLRWHLIEREPGQYDWSSAARQLAGASAAGTEVIWDLLHYGWPDDLDVWSPDFVSRFSRFAHEAAKRIRDATSGTCFYCPINEISFLSWGGGDSAYLNPFAHGRGFELKVQLARAGIAAMDVIRTVDPAARFVHTDPVINVLTDLAQPTDAPHAEGHRQAQFQGWDLLSGRIWPQIGGRADLLDIVGVNYYHNNQWIHGGLPISQDHPRYKPFHRILAETYSRYGRPIFVAETGIEGDERPAWLSMIAREVRHARELGVPVQGICLYPILDHPGWDDDRPCPNGLIRRAHGEAKPRINEAYLDELTVQGALGF
ncbi:MAG: glycosyltransferase [Pseudomonadota bacterium]|nr:glycosyltransferase [Pseudomonadota bacterium]